MTKLILLLPLLGVLASCAAGTQARIDEAQESALAQELTGRVAGQAKRCVDLGRLGGNRGFGRNTILFTGAGRMAFLNRTRGPCTELTPFRILVTRPTGGQLCSGDIISVVDASTGGHFGSCALGDFVPYTRGS